jgi:hypothetical protein
LLVELPHYLANEWARTRNRMFDQHQQIDYLTDLQ